VITVPDVRVEINRDVLLGHAELIPDPGRRAAGLLMVNGVAQSYVDLDDPTFLEFEYVRRVATVIDSVAPAATPLDVLHLGGGGMCIPRYVAATRPGSAQVVIERDAGVADLVTEYLPLPPDAGIDLRIEAGRAAVASTGDDAYDLVVLDAYEGAVMPRDLTTGRFARDLARVIRPDGLLVANVTDQPALAFTRVLAATLRTEFRNVAVISGAGMMRGRRFGNLLVIGAHDRFGQRRHAMGRARAGDEPARVITGVDLDTFLSGAQPIGD
jgi:hypothetical protein